MTSLNESTTAHDHAVEHARRLRVIIEACERISGDPTETPERREAARGWLEQFAWDELTSGGGYLPAPTVAAGGQRHTRGGGQAEHEWMEYDGWGDER